MGARFFTNAAVFGILAVLLACAGCGSSTSLGSVPAENLVQGLPWPPDAARQPSSTNYNFDGNQWMAKSDSAVDAGSFLALNGGGELAWAIYGIAGLSSTNELVQVGVTFSETPAEAGDGTQLFIALANYGRDSWEWIDPAASPWEQDVLNSADYRSPSGGGYLAVALAGPGGAAIETVHFTSNGDYVGVPQNLTAETIAVELVQLDWEAVDGAMGYNVYRSSKPDMSSKLKVNESLVTEITYEDEFMGFGDFYRNRHIYYQVTAMGAVESEPSNIAKTWSFGIDMPAPQNFRVLQKAATAIRVGWDWDGPNPSTGFAVYVDTVPDFHIDKDTVPADLPSPSKRDFTLLNCESGVTYYFKMCACSGANKGRLTDEISDTPVNYWNWSDVKTIATGQIPLKAAKLADGEIGVAYFNGMSVDVATSSSGVWSTDTALLGSDSTRIYSSYMDFAYANGVYLIVAWDARAGDAWVAHGAPTAWTRTRVHGDGGTGLLHPESGLYIICAASDTELSIAHLYNRTEPDISEFVLHTKPPEGGSWSQTVIRSLDRNSIEYPLQPAHNLAFFNDDLFYLGNDGGEIGLFFTSRNGGWDFVTTDIRSGNFRFRKYLDLTRFQSQWYTTAYDSILNKLYLLDEEATPPWNTQEITQDSFNGYYARMDAEGDEAVMIFKAGQYIQFALYSKEWNAEPIVVPGVSDFSNSLDILLINGVPYFIFGDDDTGQIKIARGVPPAE